MKEYKHILAAIDLSQRSQQTIATAKKFAELYDAKLTLLTVVEPLPAIAYGYAESGDIADSMIADAKKKLHELAKKHSINEDSLMLENGYPKSVILNLAEKEHVDLILLGSHGHHGVLNTLLGSTATAIANNADCDVFILRAK